LTYIDELLATLKSIFVKLFEPFLATFIASLHAASKGKILSTVGETAATWDFSKAFENWDAVFNKILHGLESKATQVPAPSFLLYPLNSHTFSRIAGHVSNLLRWQWSLALPLMI
jgi:hypothetical protein